MTESGIRRKKLSNRLRNRNFFVETLWRRATFRVSEEKFLISFWQRFFFLWLRFFLFARNKKKEMNKTASYTKIFRFAQYDITTKTLRCAQHDKAIPLFSPKEDYTRELHR